MMRSLYSGVAGLKTHQTKMDVIGNNIANVNTTAFKSSSITFSELMSQTTQKASGPNATTGTGGVNARQIGLGVKSGAISINIDGQGSAQSTGNPFDIMITGDNFFVVNNGTENFFTRDGSFYVDGGGNLAMTSTGYNVMGWQVDEETGEIKKDTVTALRIMSSANMTYPPEATSKAYMDGILDRNDTDVTSASGKVVNLNFFDALGYEYTARFVFKQSGNINEYSVELDKILDSNGEEIDTSGATQALFGENSTQYVPGKVNFDNTNYAWNEKVLKRGGVAVANLEDIFDTSTGELKDLTAAGAALTGATVEEQLNEIAKAYGYEGSAEEFLNLIYKTPESAAGGDSVELTIQKLLYNRINDASGTITTGDTASIPTGSEFDTVGRKFVGIKVNFDGNTGYFTGVNGLQNVETAMLNLNQADNLTSPWGGSFSDVEIDFSEISVFNNKGTSTLGATSGDAKGVGSGRRLGDMIGVSVQQNGMIYASYDNGMTKLLGQIATASFANASGLEKQGDNLYSATLNSGEFDGIGTDVTANGGYMSTGQLEMSNVDLSSEFTEMITTQRGFQANSRIITVSDTLLEELTNLKR